MGTYIGRPLLETKVSDDLLYQRVHESLMSQVGLDFSHIDISIEAGFVFLRGPVSTGAAKMVVGYIVSSLPGVKDVYNLLQVRSRS